MDFDAIRRNACRKPPPKKAEPKPTEPPKPPPAAPAAKPTPAPSPAGMQHGPQHGPCFQPYMGHYIGDSENVPVDHRYGYLEHSRTWKLGFHPNYSDNYSHQGYQGQIPVPQDYYEGCYGDPRMNSRENYRQIGYYPDHSICSFNSQSLPGYITNSRGRMGISGPPQRLALPPPDRYMGDYHDDHDHHHGYGQLSQGRPYRGNHLAPRIQEFGPGAYGPPPLLGPPPNDSNHFSGGPSRSQYNLPSTYGYGNVFSDENPNACSVM